MALAILLQKAGYSIDAQRKHLMFYHHNIVPKLGAGPDAQGLPKYWKSFMTDHFSPVELSWEWGCSGDAPIIRFSFEPIGPFAGTPVDPLNQHATNSLVRRYQPLIQDCDLRLYDYFSAKLLTYSSTEADLGPANQGHRSRTFAAFELAKDALMLKAYFLPAFKAAEMGQSTWEVISQAIQDLPAYSIETFTGLTAIENFMVASSFGSELQAEIFAIDCVKPIKSRLKVYMRSRSTCFDSVRDIMTLGGALNDDSAPGSSHGLKELEKLWRLVLFCQGNEDEPEFSATNELSRNDHRTAGILYYFDIKHGMALPGVKVYIPVRHYCENDRAIAKGLSTYLYCRGQGFLASKYVEALERIGSSSSPSLHCRLGLQTYLGCSIVGGELRLTSYIAPKVYKVQRL